jgi:hypothetical protein
MSGKEIRVERQKSMRAARADNTVPSWLGRSIFNLLRVVGRLTSAQRGDSASMETAPHKSATELCTAPPLRRQRVRGHWIRSERRGDQGVERRWRRDGGVVGRRPSPCRRHAAQFRFSSGNERNLAEQKRIFLSAYGESLGGSKLPWCCGSP